MYGGPTLSGMGPSGSGLGSARQPGSAFHSYQDQQTDSYGLSHQPSLDYQTGPAPGPAPTSARSYSMGPTAVPSSSITGAAAYADRRKMLTSLRQHRSMDMVGGLDHSDEMAPLSIATGYGQPSSYGGALRQSSGPLSNPTTTNNQYWQSANKSIYDDNLGGGLSLQREFEQLKADYAANLEKLNQTMHSIKTFWSPELKRERQMRREEATRINQLERMLTAAGGSAASLVGGNAAVQMEIAARDERIRQLNAMLDEYTSSNLMSSNSEIRVRELEQTIQHMQEMLKQAHSGDASGRYALESALRRIDEKSDRIAQLEDELGRLRLGRAQQPRDFTDKTITNHDIVTLRMKMERSELELNEKTQELATSQTRLRNMEDENAELKAHLQLLKDQNTQREQTGSLLQGDVEALRAKLESKNQALEQREARIERLEKDLTATRNESSDRLDSVRQTEQRLQQLMNRSDGLENTLRDKDAEIDRMKQRLAAHPDVVKEKEYLAKIEQGEREKKNLEQLVDQLRRNADKEQKQQLETYQSEAAQLRATVENLQKEMTDRDVLLESQNEKIGDLARELAAAESRLSAAMVDKGADELRQEVESARSEVDKLLKMVRALEKENASVVSQFKQLQGTVDRDGGAVKIDGRTGLTLGTTAKQQNAYTKRIEELEEALRESVTITAEREVHLSQQKQLLQQVNQQLADSRRETQEMKRRLADLGGMDREGIVRSIEAERRQHIEQLLQYKQEALMAALAEKDAHLALLEKGRAPREEIETVRRHKDALLTQLKQENERRAMMMRADSVQGGNILQGAGPAIGVGAPIVPLTSSQHPINFQSHNAPTAMLGPPSKPPSRAGDPMVTSAELDDADGIWA